jgi:hypothetical protein
MEEFSPTTRNGDCEEIANLSRASGRRRRNWIYVLLYYILLTYCERSRWSVDRWLEARRRWKTMPPICPNFGSYIGFVGIHSI